MHNVTMTTGESSVPKGDPRMAHGRALSIQRSHEEPIAAAQAPYAAVPILP